MKASSPDKELTPVRLRLRTKVEAVAWVYFRPKDEVAPTKEALQQTTLAWIQAHSKPPLRDELLQFVQASKVVILVGPRGLLPPAPVQLIRTIGAGELEDRRMVTATHEVALVSVDTFGPLRLGYWGPLAAARAIASSLGGAALDTLLPRLLPYRSYEDDLPADGVVRMVEEIIVSSSLDQRGLAWLATVGLAKFGLREIVVRNVPPNLADSLTPAVNGLAQLIEDRAAEAAHASRGKTATLDLGNQLELTLDHCARAYGSTPRSPEHGRRSTTVGIRTTHLGGAGKTPCIEIVPPPGYEGEIGPWLHDIPTTFTGWRHMTRFARTSDYEMQAARERALTELPVVKKRFQRRLPAGSRLYVRCGFPVDDDSAEYMWVVVNTWKGTLIRGQIADDPHQRTDLRGGQSVKVEEAEVFDWMISHTDGRTEGGHTAEPIDEDEE